MVWGRDAGILEYRLLLLLAYLMPVVLVALSLSAISALLPLLTLPMAIRWSRYLADTTGRALNRCLAGTARLIFLHGCALAVGVALTPLIWD